MLNIPDAPWIRDPEKYERLYYGKSVMKEDNLREDDEYGEDLEIGEED